MKPVRGYGSLWAGAVGAIIALGAPPPATGQTLSLNLHEALADTKAVLATGGVANIVVIGDSLSFRDSTWIYEFRHLMQADYGDAGRGYEAFSLWTGAGFNTGWTLGYIGQDTPPHRALDGLWASSTSGPGSPEEPTNAWYSAQAPYITTHLIAGAGS